MASGTLGAEEVRVKHRWNENSQVYTRKIRRVNTTVTNNNQDTATTPTNNQGAATTAKESDVVCTDATLNGNGICTATAITDDCNITVPPPDSPAQNPDFHLPNSHPSPFKCANSQHQQQKLPVSQSSPPKEGESEHQLQLQLSPTKNVEPKYRLQSSPAQNAESEHQPQLQSSTAIGKESEHQPQSQSSSAKNVESEHAHQSQPSPAHNAESEHQHQLQSPSAQNAESEQQLQSSLAKNVESEHHQQPNWSKTDLVSDDSSRQEGVLPNGHGVILENGSAFVMPVTMPVDDGVNISSSADRSKQHLIELKRKLLSDLDHVRNLAKKLGSKEAQLIVFSGGLTSSGDGGAGGVITSTAGQCLSQYSTSDGFGKEGVLSGLNGSIHPRHLSVSVMDNSHGAMDIVDKEKRTPKANQFYQNSDFICGKEKLPPAESNKKVKSNGGKKKHGGGITEVDKQIFKKCGCMLQQLMKHKHGWVFNAPVDVKALCLHDYYDIIKRPMDLGTVKIRLNKNWYKSPLEFAEDVRLTFHNAMTYNSEGQDVHAMAVELFNIFEEKWMEIEADYNSKQRDKAAYDIGLQTPTSRQALMPLYASQPPVYQGMKHLEKSGSFAVPVESRQKPVHSAPVGRTPAPKKPKAKDPDKRNMTFEEKQRLSTKLQAIPPEKLDSIVQIIRKRNSSVNQHDDEIEVDIDGVDAETLWELDRFVTNYRKNLSKQKRKAELASKKQSVAPTRPGVPQEMVPDVTTEVAVTSPVRDSSSSSSSSSNSGSSSSDSDSNSSSGSDRGE